MSIRSYKYRIYPNKTVSNRLQWVLDRCRELYNAALAERKEAWRIAGKSISCYDQMNDLPEIKREQSTVFKNVFKCIHFELMT